MLRISKDYDSEPGTYRSALDVSRENKQRKIANPELEIESIALNHDGATLVFQSKPTKIQDPIYIADQRQKIILDQEGKLSIITESQLSFAQ